MSREYTIKLNKDQLKLFNKIIEFYEEESESYEQRKVEQLKTKLQAKQKPYTKQDKR